jgi:hypothetical protein
LRATGNRERCIACLLRPPLDAAGAKKDIIEDLARAYEGLKPFREHSIKDFAGFLAQAEEYARTGVIPVQAKPPKAPRAAKLKVPALTLEDAKALVTSLYDRAIDDAITYEHIGTEIQKPDKLTAKHLGEVAKHFGLVPGKAKEGLFDAIREKIERRKTTHVRTQF